VTTARRWSQLEAAELLVCSTALSELDRSDALKLVALMQPRHVQAGTVLVQEGLKDTDFMLLILDGEASVQSDTDNGHSSSDPALDETPEGLILSILGPGNLIGEMGVLDGEPRSATCSAVSDMDVAILRREDLGQLMQSHPQAACNFLSVMLKRVSEKLRLANKKLRLMRSINQSLTSELHATSPQKVVNNIAN
jgi:CRP/FNR family transcriptional regulator, cyclic AMP receptor protein